MSEMIQIDSSAGPVACYVARPAGGTDAGTAANTPGVLLLHAWWGLTDHFKRVCDRLAAEGFVAVAPDLHKGQTADTPEQAKALLGSVPDDERFAIVDAALTHVHTITRGKVGFMGFSMGASYATWLSPERRAAAGAMVLFYGGEDADLKTATTPIQWHFAEADEFVSPDDVRKLQEDARTQDKRWEVYVYPGTEHAFFNTSRPEAYKPDAAALAWKRLLTFFRRHLA